MRKLEGHVPVLDGIRGLAILLVLIAHFNGEAILKEYFPVIGPIVTKIMLTGLMGVDLFFILSGFLITGILLKTIDSERYFYNFYARRFLRIFPLYYGVLFSIFWILPIFVKLDAPAQFLSSKQWWLWSYLTNFPGHPNLDSSEVFHLGHFWSLAVEEHFYLIWPLVVFSFPVHQLKKICLSWTAFSVFAGIASCFADGWVSHALRWSTICFSGGLTLGAYGALVSIEESGLERFALIAKKVVIYAGFLFIALAMVPRKFEPELINILTHYMSWIFFSAIVILVIVSEKNSLYAKFFSNSIMIFFGKISYGLYVYHGLLRPVFERWFDRQILVEMVGSPLFGIILYFVLSIGSSIIISWLSWHLFESQVLKFKKYFESSRVPGRRKLVPQAIGDTE